MTVVSSRAAADKIRTVVPVARPASQAHVAAVRNGRHLLSSGGYARGIPAGAVTTSTVSSG